MSTHAIGPVRLLLGSLVLLLVGAGGYRWLDGRAATGHDVLVLRDGPVELEPWTADVRAEGSTLHWDHTVTGIQLLIAKAGSDDEEYVVMDPITVPEAKSLVVDFRVGNVRTVEKAMVLSMDDSGVKIAVNEGEFARKGDLWAHTGFLQNGQRKRFEIAKLEFRDAQDHAIVRYQNPDMGRRVRFRVRMTGTSTPKASAH